MWMSGVEHVALLLGMIATLWGLYRGIKAWRTERTTAHEARAEQQRVIDQIAAEFRPNHGSSMADRLVRIEDSVNDHHAKADGWFADNAAAHQEIHRRIDGVFQLLAGPGSNQPRKIAEWHAAQRAKDEEG